MRRAILGVALSQQMVFLFSPLPAAAEEESVLPDAVSARSGDAAAEETCAAFELEECVRLNQALLARPDLDSQRRAAAYLRLASAFAAMDDVAQSSGYWRLLLRLRPELDLPAETSPKILMVFRSVQVEEERLRETVDQERHRRMVERIVVEMRAPSQHQGGLPLRLSATLVDPDDGVKRAWLRYRLAGHEEFASVPLTRADGSVSAELPGAVTAGREPRQLDVFLELQDADGRVLKTEPSADTPRPIQVLPGEVPITPLWQQPLFLRLVGGALAIGVPLAGAVILTTGLALLGGTVATLWLSSVQPGLQDRRYQEVP